MAPLVMAVVVHLVLPVEEFVVEGKESRGLREVRRRVAAAVRRRGRVAAVRFERTRHSVSDGCFVIITRK